MAIKDTYAEILTEQIIRTLLSEGIDPSPGLIQDRFEELTVNNDLSKPLFQASDFTVERSEASSASQYNSTNNLIAQDLKVAYRHMLTIANSMTENFDRWKTESALLETRLDRLQERINSLLLVGQDTAGYLNFVQDNFRDISKVDLDNTTALVNTDKGYVCFGVSNIGATKIDLTGATNEDVSFALLTRRGVVAVNSLEGSQTRYAVSDKNNAWQEQVITSQPGPVSVELKIKLPVTTTITRIDVDLHQASLNSSVTVTPLLSLDNFNYVQLPIANFSRQVVDKATFQFTAQEALYVKLILTKPGYDLTKTDKDQRQYIYEFGVDEVSLYEEGYSTSNSVFLVSEPLSVQDEEGVIQEFSRLTLEVCEDIPEDTDIIYSVAAFDSATTAFADLAFIEIDPNNRDSTIRPTVLDFGEMDIITISGVYPSYNALASSGIFGNPAQQFKYVADVAGTVAAVNSGLSSAPRYFFELSNQYILDHIVNSGINSPAGSLEIWRNVAVRGNSDEVRGVSRGWGYAEPYYQTTIYVGNPKGIDVDFGSSPVIIDSVPLVGKVNVGFGIHSIQVHQNNWIEINGINIEDLIDLKTVDTLYPYNQRYLVEGFEYPGGWPGTDEQIYQGFDIVAQYLMKEVSVFDMNHNVASDNYKLFARDFDVEDTAGTILGVSATKAPSVVFLIKVDEENADFQEEQFLIKFQSVNSLFKYLRLKAELRTENEEITPYLDSYRIKLSV